MHLGCGVSLKAEVFGSILVEAKIVCLVGRVLEFCLQYFSEVAIMHKRRNSNVDVIHTHLKFNLVHDWWLPHFAGVVGIDKRVGDNESWDALGLQF